jgi:hypothetical protein
MPNLRSSANYGAIDDISGFPFCVSNNSVVQQHHDI